MSRQEVKDKFEQHRTEMKEQERLNPGEPRIIGWLFTMAHRLFDIACDDRDERTAGILSEEVQRNELVQRGKNDLTYRLIRRNDVARLATVQSDWEMALRNWASFLDIELPGFEEFVEQDLVEFHRDRPEQAMCYREAGNVFREVGQIETACRVWRKGLQCPDDAGNKFFKKDIQQLVDQLCR